MWEFTRKGELDTPSIENIIFFNKIINNYLNESTKDNSRYQERIEKTKVEDINKPSITLA